MSDKQSSIRADGKRAISDADGVLTKEGERLVRDIARMFEERHACDRDVIAICMGLAQQVWEEATGKPFIVFLENETTKVIASDLPVVR